MAKVREEVSRYFRGNERDGRKARPPVVPEIAKAYQNDPRTQLAAQAMVEGTSGDPTAQGKYAMADGVARMLQAGIGGYADRRQQTQYRADEDALLATRAARAQQGMAAMGAGGGVAPPPAQPAPPPPPPPQAAPAPAQGGAGPQGMMGKIAAALQGGKPQGGTPQGALGALAAGGQPGGGNPFPKAAPQTVSLEPSYALARGVDTLKAQGARVTSTYRDPAKNAKVGGVRDSYHQKLGPNGEPMAYDLVPRTGETMAELAARTKRELPDADVIDEGDHVHVEPSPRMMAAAKGTGTPPPPAPPMDAFAEPRDIPVPDLPAAMERPTAPQAVAATKSPLLAAAYEIMLGANPYESAQGQDMYQKGLAEQGGFDEAAAGREQDIRDTGYQSELGMYATDVNAQRSAAIDARKTAEATNTKREDSYVDYVREAREKALDRAERARIAQTEAAARVAAAGAGAREPKKLSDGAINKLTTEGTGLDTVERLNAMFDDKYVGRLPGIGSLGVAANKVIGGDPGLAAWWQEYDEWVQGVRHGRFGASLTKTEKESFEKIVVKASTAPQIARDNLARQQAILATAVGRRARTYQMQYDPAIIAEAIGRDPSELGMDVPAPGTAGKPGEGQPSIDDLVAQYSKAK